MVGRSLLHGSRASTRERLFRPSGNGNFTTTLHRTHSMNQCCGSTMELVNGVTAPDNTRALAHAFLALRGRCRHTGSAAARAFAFQGRRFVLVNKATSRTEQAGQYRPTATQGGASVRVSNLPAGGNSRRQHKASSSARGAHPLTQRVRGRMSSVPLRKAMPLMTPAARPCAGTAANRLCDRPCDWPTNGRRQVRMHRLRRAVGRPKFSSGSGWLGSL